MVGSYARTTGTLCHPNRHYELPNNLVHYWLGAVCCCDCTHNSWAVKQRRRLVCGGQRRGSSSIVSRARLEEPQIVGDCATARSLQSVPPGVTHFRNGCRNRDASVLYTRRALPRDYVSEIDCSANPGAPAKCD